MKKRADKDEKVYLTKRHFMLLSYTVHPSEIVIIKIIIIMTITG